MLSLQGLSETHEDRKRDRERGRAAEKYDELDKGKKDRHWSEKARGEMTERDWRIFREDFNIAYKGVNVSATALPLRNWAEAELPHELNQVRAPGKSSHTVPAALWLTTATSTSSAIGRSSSLLLDVKCACPFRMWQAPIYKHVYPHEGFT